MIYVEFSKMTRVDLSKFKKKFNSSQYQKFGVSCMLCNIQKKFIHPDVS